MCERVHNTAQPKKQKCAYEHLDANQAGYREFALHHSNFVTMHLAFGADDMLKPPHPRACTNPAGCFKKTPCWYHHHQRIQLDGLAEKVYQRARERLEDMDGVGIFERFSETLKLFQCKTGVYTGGHSEVRRAIHQPNRIRTTAEYSSWKDGYSPFETGGGIESETGGMVDPEERQRWITWRAAMRSDPEVLHALKYDLALYHIGLKLFEEQLRGCRIRPSESVQGTTLKSRVTGKGGQSDLEYYDTKTQTFLGSAEEVASLVTDILKGGGHGEARPVQDSKARLNAMTKDPADSFAFLQKMQRQKRKKTDDDEFDDDMSFAGQKRKKRAKRQNRHNGVTRVHQEMFGGGR